MVGWNTYIIEKQYKKKKSKQRCKKSNALYTEIYMCY